jgi:hypothetical protein
MWGNVKKKKKGAVIGFSYSWVSHYMVLTDEPRLFLQTEMNLEEW